MHEAGIAKSVLETALAAAERDGAREILRVDVRLGVMSGVVPDALRFAFDALKRGTLASASELAITEVPYLARCPACAHEFEVFDSWGIAPCPACDEPTAMLARGDELVIEALEVI